MSGVRITFVYVFSKMEIMTFATIIQDIKQNTIVFKIDCMLKIIFYVCCGSVVKYIGDEL